MFRNPKELLPDNKGSALIVIGVVLLFISHALAKFSQPALVILRYVLFIAAIALYFSVALTFHRERLRKKKVRETTQEN
jgi:Co/Zn/Cd efflux system component